MEEDLRFFQYRDDSNEKHLVELNKNDSYTLKFFSDRYNESFKEVFIDKEEKFWYNIYMIKREKKVKIK